MLVGREVARRTLSGDDRIANLAFAMWWYGLGALSFAGGLFSVAAALGQTDLALHVVFLNVAIILICAGFWGLAYYLLYVYTGQKFWIWPVAAFYGFYLVYLLYLIAAAQPTSIQLTKWGTEFTWTREPASFPNARTILLPFVLPLVLGALAYLSLLFRVKVHIQRYRIAMVAGSILVWFGSSFVATLLQISAEDWWQIANRCISLGAALMVFAAFRPPPWISRRLDAAPPAPPPVDGPY